MWCAKTYVVCGDGVLEGVELVTEGEGRLSHRRPHTHLISHHVPVIIAYTLIAYDLWCAQDTFLGYSPGGQPARV